MTQDLDEMTKRLRDLYEIKGKLIKKEATLDDAERLRQLAEDDKSPMAEYLYGVIHYFGEVVNEDRPTALRYFDICRAHACGSIQMSLATIYFHEPENFWDRGIECIEAAAKDRHPIAKKILRKAKWGAVGCAIRDIFQDNS